MQNLYDKAAAHPAITGTILAGMGLAAIAMLKKDEVAEGIKTAGKKARKLRKKLH